MFINGSNKYLAAIWGPEQLFNKFFFTELVSAKEILRAPPPPSPTVDLSGNSSYVVNCGDLHKCYPSLTCACELNLGARSRWSDIRSQQFSVTDSYSVVHNSWHSIQHLLYDSCMIRPQRRETNSYPS